MQNLIPNIVLSAVSNASEILDPKGKQRRWLGSTDESLSTRDWEFYKELGIFKDFHGKSTQKSSILRKFLKSVKSSEMHPISNGLLEK